MIGDAPRHLGKILGCTLRIPLHGITTKADVNHTHTITTEPATI